MGNLTQDWEDPGQFPQQGGLPDGKDSSKEEHDGQVVLTTAGQHDDGSGSGRSGYVRPLTPEYRRPVYFHLADTIDGIYPFSVTTK